jgi:hypothetical protein
LFLTLRDRDPVSNKHSEDVVAKEAEQARKILQVRPFAFCVLQLHSLMVRQAGYAMGVCVGTVLMGMRFSLSLRVVWK